MLRENIISLEEYVSLYNSTLMNYYTSSAKNMSSEKLEQMYWYNSDAAGLPYQRGNILAHNWNAIININTKNKQSLDKAIKIIIKLNQNLTIKNVKKQIGKYISINEVTKNIQDYIIEGYTIPVHSFSLGKCYTINTDKITENNITIDVPQFKPNKNIKINHQECISWFYDNQ